MSRLAAYALAAVIAPGMAVAQAATCGDQAQHMIDTVPGMQTRIGIDSAEAYLASDTRLLVTMALYDSAAGALAGRSPDYGQTRDYWLENLVVADGLIHCFREDGDDFTGDRAALRDRFFNDYPDDLRVRFAAAALGELGLFGGMQ